MNKRCLLVVSLDSSIVGVDYINHVIQELESRTTSLTLLLFDEPEKINQKILSSHNEDTINWLIKLRKREIIEKIIKSNKILINIFGWFEFCDKYPVNRFIDIVKNTYNSNRSFKRECENQTFKNLQPKLLRKGIFTKEHESISVLVKYLLDEIGLKLFLANESYFDAEISPQEEMEIVENIKNGRYKELAYNNKLDLEFLIIRPKIRNNDIILYNVTFSYPGKSNFKIKDFNLIIPKNGIYGILGRNAVGKSTLLKLIGGHLKPSEGKIFVGEKEITYLPARTRSVSTVFQKSLLFPHLNVIENVKFGLVAQKKYSKKLIEDIALKQLIEFGLEDLRFAKPFELSIGQQQKVAIARAMVLNPAVLLLDEPTASLDYYWKKMLSATLKMLANNNSSTNIVIVSHDKDFIFTLCNNICIIDEGKIIAEGKTKDLFLSPPSIQVAEVMESGNIIEGTIDGNNFFKSYQGDINISLKGQQKELGYNKVALLLRRFSFSLTNNCDTESIEITGRVKYIELKPSAYKICIWSDCGREFNVELPHQFINNNIDIKRRISLYYKKKDIEIIPINKGG